jgi:hypothetical protein
MKTLALVAALVAAAPVLGADQRVEDDYPRALAAARERGVPLVVDLWAPW